MRRTARYRIRKRDGRIEWLRTSKLGRSIHRAMQTAADEVGDVEAGEAAGLLPGEEWRTLDLVSGVVAALREEFGEDALLSTARLAEAVPQALWAAGLPLAARAFTRVGGEQLRQRAALHLAMPPQAAELSGACAPDRLRGGEESRHQPGSVPQRRAR